VAPQTLHLNAAVAVDLVVLTVVDDGLAVLVVRRGVAPHRGRWALPGGFVLEDEDLSAAAERELAEETGVAITRFHLEQLGTYGDPRRDPRGRVISVAHLALLPDLPKPTAGTDAREARWRSVPDLLGDPRSLAFDHHRILVDGVERARSKLEYTPLGTAFCAEEFTVAELRRVYEVVWDATLDPRNFHRKVTGTAGFVRPTGRTTNREGGRPAQLYRRGDADLLYPPILRPSQAGPET